MAQSGGSGGGCLLGTVMLIGIVLLMFTVLSQAGWIPHSHDTPVWIQGDWLVGEFRECDMLTSTIIGNGQHKSSEESEHFPKLFCGEVDGGFAQYAHAFKGTDISWAAVGKDFHILPVRYFGRLERPDKVFISWRCQRKAESLTCRALN